MALVSLPFGIAVGACLALVSAGDAGCMLQHRAGDPQKNQTYSFSMDRLAYRSDCQLGSSYTSGCKTRAVMELKPCEATSREDPQELSACIQELEWPQANDFSQKIKNQETQEEAMTKAVEATGGGWGLQVSASVDFMSQSTSASTSVSFQIAQARQVRKSFIEHGRTLTLAPEARKLLEQNPWEFLNVYGGYFVQSIIHGGSFVGTATVRSLETGSSQSLGAYADLQFSGTMGFSADFKSVFEETKKDTSSFTDVQTDFQQLGGILDAQDAEVKDSEQLDALNQRFEKWSETVSKAPQQLLMSLQPWMAIGEVHEFVLPSNFRPSGRFADKRNLVCGKPQGRCGFTSEQAVAGSVRNPQR
ncbi:unnamed protein product, partial [Durusdinium trenchii]